MLQLFPNFYFLEKISDCDFRKKAKQTDIVIKWVATFRESRRRAALFA
jgi:hypothetical protein